MPARRISGRTPHEQHPELSNLDRWGVEVTGNADFSGPTEQLEPVRAIISTKAAPKSWPCMRYSEMRLADVRTLAMPLSQAKK